MHKYICTYITSPGQETDNILPPNQYHIDDKSAKVQTYYMYVYSQYNVQLLIFQKLISQFHHSDLDAHLHNTVREARRVSLR